jgi:hypothetical protein
LKAKVLSADDALVEKEVGVSRSPALLMLPIFAPAAILDGQPPVRGVNIVGQETLHFGKDVGEFVREHGAKGIQFGSTIQATDWYGF